MREAPLSKSDYRALSHFRYQIRRFLHFSEEAARAEGLEPQQHQMLLTIEGSDEDCGPTVGCLAEHLLIRHHSAVGLLDRLEERGLVERHRLARQHRDELRKSEPELVETLRAVVEQRS